MNSPFRRWGWGVAVVCCALLTAGVAGCDKSADEKLREAKGLLTDGSNPDAAEEKLEAVLEEQPDRIEAKRLMAKVHRIRGEYERAEEILDGIWSSHDFDTDEPERSGRLRNARELVRAEYLELYRSWAGEIDQTKRPEEYVEVLEKGLEYSENDADLDMNMKLAEFYWRRGQQLVEQGNKRRAAETFEKIRQLETRRGWKKRQEALDRVRQLRLDLFEKKGHERFEREAKPLIEKLDGFELDEQKRVIRIELTQSVDRQLDPDDEADREKARKMAFVALIDKLRQLALTVAGLSPETDLRKIGTDRAKEILLGGLEFDEEERTFRRGRYEIVATLPVDAAIRMAYDVKTAYEEAGADRAGAASSSGAADAGNGADGAAGGEGAP